jgi:hypothetical protein
VQDNNLYNNLIQSVFPTVHGNDEVKRGIMLMLFGSVPKTKLEGTTFRSEFLSVFWIHRIHMFLGHPDPDPLVRGMDPRIRIHITQVFIVHRRHCC